MPDTTTAVYAFTKPEEGGSPETWDTKLNTDLDSIDSEIARPRIPHNSPTVGATTTLNLALARVFKFTVSEATTLAFSNVPTSTFLARIVVVVTNGSAFTLTFPGSVTWLAGTLPPLKAAGVDIIEMFTVDGGTTWYAALVEDGGAWQSDASGFLVPKTDATYDIGTGSFRPRDIRLSRDLLAAGAVVSDSEVRSKLGSSAAGLGVAILNILKGAGLSTSSTSEVSLLSTTIPGNAMDENGDVLRIHIVGRTQTQVCTINVKFGATSCDDTIPANETFEYVVTIVRTGAATQVSVGRMTMASSAKTRRVTPAETLSGDVTLDIRGFVTSGGTLTVDSVNVTYESN